MKVVIFQIHTKEQTMEFYLSIDLGTSSVKLMLVDSEGNIANTASREYSVSYPHAGWSE
jgi:xylulokinase